MFNVVVCGDEILKKNTVYKKHYHHSMLEVVSPNFFNIITVNNWCVIRLHRRELKCKVGYFLLCKKNRLVSQLIISTSRVQIILI